VLPDPDLADYRFLLPSDPIGPGDEWEVDPKHMSGILYPLGDLAVRPRHEEYWILWSIASLSGAMSVPLDHGAWSGRIHCKYDGKPFVDGEIYDLVLLTVDVSCLSENEATGARLIRFFCKNDEARPVVQFVEKQAKFVGKGALYLDKSGHFQAFELNGTTSGSTIVQGFDGEGLGRETIDLSQQVEGWFFFRAAAAPVDLNDCSAPSWMSENGGPFRPIIHSVMGDRFLGEPLQK